MRRFNGRGLHARLNGQIVCLRDVAMQRGVKPDIVMKRYALLGHPDDVDESLFAPVQIRTKGKVLTLLPDGTMHSVCELADKFGVSQSRLSRCCVAGQRVFTREELEGMRRKPRVKTGPDGDLSQLSNTTNTGKARDPNWEFYSMTGMMRANTLGVATLNLPA